MPNNVDKTKSDFSSKNRPYMLQKWKRRKVKVALEFQVYLIKNKMLCRCFIMWKSLLYNL